MFASKPIFDKPIAYKAAASRLFRANETKRRIKEGQRDTTAVFSKSWPLYYALLRHLINWAMFASETCLKVGVAKRDKSHTTCHVLDLVPISEPRSPLPFTVIFSLLFSLPVN